MSDLILQFQDVHKSFFGVPVLKGIDLDIERGSTVGLVGENGAGGAVSVPEKNSAQSTGRASPDRQARAKRGLKPTSHRG